MKVLITGGAGYIGYSLVNALEKLTEVEEIIVYDNLSHHDINFFFYGTQLKKTSFIKSDLLNNYELQKAVQKAEVVFHLAAEVRSPYSHDDHFKYEQVNQYGTLNVFQAIENSNVKKVIYLSSAAVYGFNVLADEETPANPENEYGISKWEGEKYLQNLKNQQLYIMRVANVFGANACIRKDTVIHKLMLDALMVQKIMLLGSGEQKRAFIYLDNLVQSLTEIIEDKQQPGIYNLVQGNLSMNEIRDVLMEEMPDLEFTYVSSNALYRNVEMISKKISYTSDLQDDIRKTFHILRHTFRL